MKDMAHRDPEARYLAHRVEQPVDRWSEALSTFATGVVLVACIGVLLYAFLVYGVPS